MKHHVAVLALCAFAAGPASAQDLMDRKVGADAYGRPLEFRAFTTHEVGAFALAAGIPIGFEALPPPENPAALPSMVLTGRTVREAVAAMVAVDPRYESREEDGVLIFAASESAPRPDVPVPALRPLDAPAPAIHLGETPSRHAVALVAALLGAPRSTAIEFTDSKTITVDVPEGTVRALLNAIVRAHGHLVWMFERSRGRKPMFPYTLTFLTGSSGFGVGLSGQPSGEPLDLARFMQSPALPPSAADAIVGPRRDGYPLVVTGMWESAVHDLSLAANVPMGMEVAPRPQHVRYPPEFTATGRPLREVLDVLATRDPRYEWREVNGVIVVRPAAAWNDSSAALFSLVRDVDLQDVTMTQAVRAVASALGGGDQTYTTFPDSRTLSLSVFQGTGLDLLNALARAHGSMTWTLADAEPDEIARTGLRHRLSLAVPGIGVGLLVR